MSAHTTQKPLIVTFVSWYYLEAPIAIVRGAVGYIVAVAEIVPFGFLVLTLLSPWKNIVDRTPMHGIDLNRIMEKLSLGLLARAVGLVVRIITIALGLIFEIAILAFSIAYLSLWLAFPLAFAIALTFCFASL